MTPLETLIPPYRYQFDDRDIEWIGQEVEMLFRSGAHLTLGDHGQLLEEEIRDRSGRGFAAALASGTAALEAILRGVDVAGGEVIVPTNTFGATPVAVMRAGGTPVLADAGDDLSISVEDVARKLGPDVRAVVAVHIGGIISPSIRDLAALCRSAGVALVEDAAHALGATLDGHGPGAWGVGAAFSLFSTKVITSGEGGLLVTDDERIHRSAVLLRDHAKEDDGTMRVTGYNWRLSELQAIVARAQLRRLDEIVLARNQVSEAYDARLHGVPGLRRPPLPPEARPNGYKHVLFLEHAKPARVERDLSREGIPLAGAVYRTPCHRQEAFADFAPGPLPNADRLADSHICLPLYAGMTAAEVEKVAAAAVASVGG